MSMNNTSVASTAKSSNAVPSNVTPIADAAHAAKPKLWFDGAIHDVDAPQLDLTTHALHYGSGVFEGIRAYATKSGAAVFRLPDHLERMRQGAELLGMTFDPQQATEATVATLHANHHRDAYVRPLAWVGEGSFGLDVSGHPQHLMVSTTPTLVHLAGSRARIGVTTWRRNPADSLPPLKLCGGYVNSILAKRQTKARGFDEALFVDAHGNVVECTGANVFLVKDGKLVAVEHRDALPGITRDTLIALTGAESRTVSFAELQDADEVFACGTAAEVAPVFEVEGRVYGDNPVSRDLAALYARVVRGEESVSAQWLTEF